MHKNAKSKVCVDCDLSEEFILKVLVHQSPCHSLLLFITVLEALSSQKSHTACRWENPYAEDLVTESLEELQEKQISYNSSMEGKRLWVDMGKTKMLISSLGLGMLQKSSKNPCTMRLSGVSANSILC